MYIPLGFFLIILTCIAIYFFLKIGKEESVIEKERKLDELIEKYKSKQDIKDKR